jgi:hypothetical protein
VLNRNNSYTIPSYSVLHGGNVIESFVGSKYPESTVSLEATIYNIGIKLRLMRSALNKSKYRKRCVMTEEKIDGTGTYSIRTKPEEVVLPFGSVVGLGKKYRSHWDKVAKVGYCVGSVMSAAGASLTIKCTLCNRLLAKSERTLLFIMLCKII